MKDVTEKILIESAKINGEGEEIKYDKEQIFNNLLLDFETTKSDLKTSVKRYKRAYEEIVREDFPDEEFRAFVSRHTKDTKTIFEAKLEIEKRITQLEDKIRAMKSVIQIDEDVIRDTKKYFKLNTKMTKELTPEEIENRTKIIETIANSSEDLADVHETAKSMERIFDGMGDNYQKALEKALPGYKEFLDTSKNEKIEKLGKHKGQLEGEIEEFETLKWKAEELIRKYYDPRLEEILRGTKHERDEKYKQAKKEGKKIEEWR